MRTDQHTGIQFLEDDANRYSAHLDAGSLLRLRRFRGFLRAAVLAPNDQVGAAAARMVALDAVATGALDAISASGILYLHRSRLELEWEQPAPPRLERRILCSHTVQALQPPGVLGFGRLKHELAQFLTEVEGYRGLSRSIVELDIDARCWWRLHLPPALFFHVAGVQVMSALSRSCRARQDLRAVPQAESIGSATAEPAHTEACAELLDHAEASTSSDQHDGLLKQALVVMGDRKGEPEWATRRRWLDELLALGPKGESAGPITSLLLAWLVDMCESGTIQTSSPRAGTVREYFRAAAFDLWRGLRGLTEQIGRLDPGALEGLYQSLLDQGQRETGTGAARRKLAAALTNFHAFLMHWLDLPPLRASLAKDLPAPRVRAHLIWQHELDTAIRWAVAEAADTAQALRITLALALLATSGLRIGELQSLRMGDVHVCADEVLEIEVSRSRRGLQLKSAAAQRRVLVRDARAVTLTLDWLRRRRIEGTTVKDLLLADTVPLGRAHSPHQLRRHLNRLLKASTGHPDATVHDLRHSAANSWIAPLLCSSPMTEPYRLQQVAVSMGHVHAGTTLRNYVHSYEEALRIHLDAALRATMSWSSGEAGCLMGVRADAIRQRSHRLGVPVTELAWQALLASGHESTAFERIDAPWRWEAPRAPSALRPLSTASSVPETLRMMQLLAGRQSAAAVAAHFRISAAWVQALEQTAIQVSHEVAMRAWPMRVGSRAREPVTLEQALRRLGVNLARATGLRGKHAQILESLLTHDDSALLKKAWESWCECLRGRHLALDEPGKALGLYRWLRAAGVDPGVLRICHEPDDARLIDRLNAEFVAVFGQRPRLQPKRPRPWTPRAHLQLDREPWQTKAAGAFGSLGGLHAWLLAAGVHFRMEADHGARPSV